MGVSTYKSAITSNFTEYDRLLARVISRRVRTCLFAIRSSCCVYAEIWRAQRSKRNLWSWLVLVVNPWLKVLLFPFLQVEQGAARGDVLLATGPVDLEIAGSVGCEALSLRIRYGVGKRGFANLRFVGVALRTILRLLLWNPAVPILNVWYGMPELFKYLAVYQQFRSEGIRTLTTENDIDPAYVAVVQCVKEAGIPTIKLEYYFIDRTHHNNVFCDYYFCPGTFNRRIREEYPGNRGLKYMEGGIIPWDRLGQLRWMVGRAKPYILYFGHPEEAVADLRYVRELSHCMPAAYSIVVKPHPRARRESVRCLAGVAGVTILPGGGIDIYDLIARCAFCFAIMSVVIIEAKHICDNAFFINYESGDASNVLDYAEIGRYIDVITSREQLTQVLAGKGQPKGKREFLHYFNMAFPTSAGRFRRQLASIRSRGDLDRNNAVCSSTGIGVGREWPGRTTTG
jgi:hypothetical protein